MKLLIRSRRKVAATILAGALVVPVGVVGFSSGIVSATSSKATCVSSYAPYDGNPGSGSWIVSNVGAPEGVVITSITGLPAGATVTSGLNSPQVEIQYYHEGISGTAVWSNGSEHPFSSNDDCAPEAETPPNNHPECVDYKDLQPGDTTPVYGEVWIKSGSGGPDHGHYSFGVQPAGYVIPNTIIVDSKEKDVSHADVCEEMLPAVPTVNLEASAECVEGEPVVNWTVTFTVPETGEGYSGLVSIFVDGSTEIFHQPVDLASGTASGSFPAEAGTIEAMQVELSYGPESDHAFYYDPTHPTNIVVPDDCVEVEPSTTTTTTTTVPPPYECPDGTNWVDDGDGVEEQDECHPPAPPVDVCVNLPGPQAGLPSGYMDPEGDKVCTPVVTALPPTR